MMSSHIPGSDLYAAPTSDQDQPLQQQLSSELNNKQPNGLLNNATVTAVESNNGVKQQQYIDTYMTTTASTEGALNTQQSLPSTTASGVTSTQPTTTTTGQQQQPAATTTTTTTTNRQTVVVPKVEIKLFVGRLPKQMTESELEPLFSQYGQVVETVIIRDKATGQHKGSAFIKMASLTDSDKAIRSLHNIKVVDNQLGPIQVKYANGESERLGLPAENCNPGIDVGKLFVGSLPRGVTEQQVRDIFEPYGVIEETVLMKDPGSGQTKGCAFVKYAYKENAIFAIKNLNGVHHCSGCPRALEVKFAESRRTGPPPHMPTAGGASHMQGSMHPSIYGMSAMSAAHRVAAPVAAPPSNLNPRSAGGWTEYFTADGRPYYHNETSKTTQWTKPVDFDRMVPPSPSAPSSSIPGSSADVAGPHGANVFVFHIPNEWTQTEIIQNFSQFGRVISCYIATDRTTGRNKGYGFVSFDSVEAAANAVLGMNGFLVGSKRLKVSIKNGEEAYVAHLLSPQAQAAAIQAGQMGASPGASLGNAGGYGMGQQHAPTAAGDRGGIIAPGVSSYGGYSGSATSQQQQQAVSAAAAGGYGPAVSGGYAGSFRTTPY